MRFVLTPETQLLRELDVHSATKAMAAKLGISGQIETRVGDFRKTGWTTGWVGPASADRDVLVEVYVVPLTPITLSMETENLVLRAEVDRLAGAGAADAAVSRHQARLREQSEARSETPHV